MKPEPKADNSQRPTGVAVKRVVSCVGTQPPAGYVAWHEWAESQYKAGMRQTRCPQCDLWKFPQEMSAVKHTSSVTTTKWGNTKVITTGNICNKCAANKESAAVLRSIVVVFV